jgi:hypothetical protein
MLIFLLDAEKTNQNPGSRTEHESVGRAGELQSSGACACRLRVEPIVFDGGAAGVKADLDEQARRAALRRRETVVRTSTGKIVEKRLNATIVRRRAVEPRTAQPSATSSASV